MLSKWKNTGINLMKGNCWNNSMTKINMLLRLPYPVLRRSSMFWCKRNLMGQILRTGNLENRPSKYYTSWGDLLSVWKLPAMNSNYFGDSIGAPCSTSTALWSSGKGTSKWESNNFLNWMKNGRCFLQRDLKISTISSIICIWLIQFAWRIVSLAKE